MFIIFKCLYPIKNIEYNVSPLYYLNYETNIGTFLFSLNLNRLIAHFANYFR